MKDFLNGTQDSVFEDKTDKTLGSRLEKERIGLACGMMNSFGRTRAQLLTSESVEDYKINEENGVWRKRPIVMMLYAGDFLIARRIIAYFKGR